MVSIARKNLFHEWTRFLISMGGVAFSIFLMLYFLCVLNGFEFLLESFVNNQDADVWVIEQGKIDFFRGTSFLPETLAFEIESYGGVKGVDKLLTRTIRVGEDENISLIIIGYNTRTGNGGPWNIVEGKSSVGPNEIIIDRAFAKKYGYSLYDLLDIKDEEFRIVGVNDYSSVLMWQYSFITYEDFIRLFPDTLNMTNYLMVQLKHPEFADSIKGTLESAFEVNAFTKPEFLVNNKQLIREGFLPILYAILLIGLLVGTAFVAVTIYTVTVERIKEYGILKAIGASNPQLYSIIFQQSLISSIIGYFVGCVFTFMSVFITYNYYPELTTILRFESFIYMFFVSILISLVASYIPIKKVSKVDPLMIFR